MSFLDVLCKLLSPAQAFVVKIFNNIFQLLDTHTFGRPDITQHLGYGALDFDLELGPMLLQRCLELGICFREQSRRTGVGRLQLLGGLVCGQKTLCELGNLRRNLPLQLSTDSTNRLHLPLQRFAQRFAAVFAVHLHVGPQALDVLIDIRLPLGEQYAHHIALLGDDMLIGPLHCSQSRTIRRTQVLQFLPESILGGSRPLLQHCRQPLRIGFTRRPGWSARPCRPRLSRQPTGACRPRWPESAWGARRTCRASRARRARRPRTARSPRGAGGTCWPSRTGFRCASLLLLQTLVH
mmetsp:Transcript_89618/g.232349  ORF Transcript_89618/g.232349 Transcript_89618/m.232349 type:complete len:295 (-) Transcript_89618:604-1488(-)